MPGGSLADNNVAQKPNTPLNPLSGAAGVSYQVPLGLSTISMCWHGTSPLLYFPLHVLPPSLTCSQSNMCFFRHSISLTSMILFCLQGKVDVAGHYEEGEMWKCSCVHTEMEVKTKHLQFLWTNICSCMSLYWPETRKTYELMSDSFADSVMRIVCLGLHLAHPHPHLPILVSYLYCQLTNKGKMA